MRRRSESPRAPTMSRPRVAAPAQAFCHVRYRAAFSLHFCVRFRDAFCCEGVIASRRVGFFGDGVVLYVFACLPFKARLLFRISSAWVGKWHPTTVAGEG